MSKHHLKTFQENVFELEYWNGSKLSIQNRTIGALARGLRPQKELPSSTNNSVVQSTAAVSSTAKSKKRKLSTTSSKSSAAKQGEGQTSVSDTNQTIQRRNERLKA